MSFRPYQVLNIVDHDGDTVKAHVSAGIDLCHTIDVRLMGVFAKDSRNPAAPTPRPLSLNGSRPVGRRTH